MRVYFLSAVRAALKLDGQFVGIIDGFERYAEFSAGDRPFCELIPDGAAEAITFVADEKFFSSPPQCLDLYRACGDVYVYARDYAPQNGAIAVVCQRRFRGALITVFSSGRTYLAADGAEFTLTPLPDAFKTPEIAEISPDGYPALSISAGGYLVIISSEGGVVFKNRARLISSGDGLEIEAPFSTCADACAYLSYSYDGKKLTLKKSVTRERRPPAPEVRHFAFFEAVLTRGQYENYLSDELKAKSREIYSYLGQFTGVCVPPSSFFERHPEERAAGLIYPRGRNVFDVKIYAVSYDGANISNIYPIN